MDTIDQLLIHLSLTCIWISNLQFFFLGTKMVFAGLKKKNERAGMLKNHLINEGMPGKKSHVNSGLSAMFSSKIPFTFFQDKEENKLLFEISSRVTWGLNPHCTCSYTATYSLLYW